MLCAVLLFMCSPAAAHPPGEVRLSCSSGTLKVDVAHSVNDPTKHYVYKIVVYVDGNIAAQKEYTSQMSSDAASDTFDLGVAPGKNIKVEAFCVIMGSASASATAQ